MTGRRFLFAAIVVLATAHSRLAFSQEPPLLTVLTDTGRVHDGLPVLRAHADPDPLIALLSRGFAGRLLRVYRWTQIYMSSRTGRPVEPAFLALSDKQGGFPRYGFYLEEGSGGVAKRESAYIDLHRRSVLSGGFGAIDQIFPHELFHVIVRRTIGQLPDGGTNQVHALALRTDPNTAFNEGFAEHAQVMAVDDPDAVPETRALAGDAALRDRAFAAFAAYERAMSARWAAAPRARFTFPLWFSQMEQVLRYHAVKERLLVREPAVPPHLLRAVDPYPAYLLANTVPGSRGGAMKSPRVLLSSEGAVSTLFWRWMTDERLRRGRRERAFYAAFGPDALDAGPLENAYLKLVVAFANDHPPDTAGMIRAYQSRFPDEREVVGAIERDVFGGPLPPPAPELWLANDAFMTGTTLFDQFRAAPRIHTFDLNAATVVDLVSVPGVTPDVAEAIVRGAPYASVDDLHRIPGVDRRLVDRAHGMAARMTRLRAEAIEETSVLSLRTILMPYLRRAGVWLAIASVLSALAYRSVRRTRWWRLALIGVATALVGLGVGWSIDAGTGLLVWTAPVVLFASPAMIWQLARGRPWRDAARTLAAWMLAAAVPAALVRPW